MEKKKSIQTTSPTRGDGWNWNIAPIDWHPLAPDWGKLVGSLANWDDINRWRELTPDEKENVFLLAIEESIERKARRKVKK